MKKIIAVLLALVILFNSVFDVKAVDPITGGATGAILGLSAPEAALLIAAALGAKYTYDHRDEVYRGMQKCIKIVQNTYDLAEEQIAKWWEDACNGHVDTTSQVWEGVKQWYTNTLQVSGVRHNYVAGTEIVYAYTGSETLTTSVDADCYAYPYRWMYSMTGSDGRFYLECKVGVVFLANSAVTSDFYSVGWEGYEGLYMYRVQRSFSSTTSDYTGFMNSVSSARYIFGHPLNAHAADYSNYLTRQNVGGVEFIGTDAAFRAIYDTAGYDIDQPEAWVGGIPNAIANNEKVQTIDDITFPDVFDLSRTINPASEKSVSQQVADVASNVGTDALPWADWVGTLADTKPYVGTIDKAYDITDTGVSDVAQDKTKTDEKTEEGTGTENPPAGGDGKLPSLRFSGLEKVFPFCLPWDMYLMLSALSAPPKTIKIDFVIPLSSLGYGLKDCKFTLDFSPLNDVAALCRDLMKFLFVYGLILATKRMLY